MFSIKDITIKQGVKGEYKELQGAYNMEQDKLNMKVNMFKNDPDYAIVEIGKVIDRTISQNEKGYWNFDKKTTQIIDSNAIGIGANDYPRFVISKDKLENYPQIQSDNITQSTIEQTQQLILSQQKSIWEALRRIGEHLDIEWFKGNQDIRDHYHNMLSDIPEGEPII